MAPQVVCSAERLFSLDRGGATGGHWAGPVPATSCDVSLFLSTCLELKCPLSWHQRRNSDESSHVCKVRHWHDMAIVDGRSKSALLNADVF